MVLGIPAETGIDILPCCILLHLQLCIYNSPVSHTQLYTSNHPSYFPVYFFCICLPFSGRLQVYSQGREKQKSYYWRLLICECNKCSEIFSGPCVFNLSLSASLSAFFLSSSSCLQFSSWARLNILTKLSRVETTAK